MKLLVLQTIHVGGESQTVSGWQIAQRNGQETFLQMTETSPKYEVLGEKHSTTYRVWPPRSDVY